MSDIKAFQCPNCHQYINNTMTACKYCGIALDPQTLSFAVDSQSKVDDAYSAGSSVRILAGAMVILFIVSIFIPNAPFINLIAIGVSVAFYITFIGVPIMLIYWAIRFSGIKTTDVGYQEAKKYCITALCMWILVFIVWLLFVILAVLITIKR